jgi:hypothetical protein
MTAQPRFPVLSSRQTDGLVVLWPALLTTGTLAGVHRSTSSTQLRSAPPAGHIGSRGVEW